MHLLDRIPLLTMRMVNLLSAAACLVIGSIMTVSYALNRQYLMAGISLPLCFALWGIVHLVWRRSGIDSNRARFAVFHPVSAFKGRRLVDDEEEDEGEGEAEDYDDLG